MAEPGITGTYYLQMRKVNLLCLGSFSSYLALPEDWYSFYLHFKKRHSLPGTYQYVHMETNHTWNCSQQIRAEAPFMATAFNSQKQSRREEGGWKRTVHQWHAQSSRRSKHAGQHCSSFSTELRNITWKVCVPEKSITHSSEAWWTCLQERFRWVCLQGRDFRESVADSPLGFLSGLKFYFTFLTLHNSAWSSPNLAKFIIC